MEIRGGGASLKIHKNVEFLLRKTENCMLPFALECFMMYKVIMESVSLCVNESDMPSDPLVSPFPAAVSAVFSRRLRNIPFIDLFTVW